MTDRRRINGLPSGTTPLVFASQVSPQSLQRPERSRRPRQHRKIFLRTGLTPSASGSAYFELQQSPLPSSLTTSHSLIPPSSTLKLSCTVHGPKPLPRSAPFSPQLVLSTHIKFTPFASRDNRRGFVRDACERDLGMHLEAALRGVIIGDRWPKSGVDVTITVLEAEDDAWWGNDVFADEDSENSIGGAGMMSVLAGCITVASAAIVEAGIDCVDTVTGGMAAIVRSSNDKAAPLQIVIDPCPSEHGGIVAACVVGYLQSRDEIAEIWMKGDVGMEFDSLLDAAVDAAKATRFVLSAVLKECIAAQMTSSASNVVDDIKARKETEGKGKAAIDVEMMG